jgi:mono/diheme cytochrome c family protein
VLGLELSQLEGALEYPNGVVADQLETWLHAGLMAAAPERTGAPLVEPAGEGSVEDRARSWLHTNCGSCHRPGEQDRVSLDLRWGVPLAETGACDVAPSAGALGIDDARVIAPGEPSRSVLIARIAETGAAKMPPVGVSSVDAEGLALITAWVAGLSGCE